MSNLRRKKTQTADLDIGMYICELDRPWLGTPFMLEGLLIEEQDQITTIENLCKFVYVDQSLSVGNHFVSSPKQSVSIKRENVTSGLSISTNSSEKFDSNEYKSNGIDQTVVPFSFLEIFREIKDSNQNTKSIINSHTDKDVKFNLSQSKNSAHKTPEYKEIDNDSSLANQIKTNVKNFISKLSYWRGKEKKINSELNKLTQKSNISKEQSTNSNFSNTLFEELPLVEEEIANIYPVFEKSQIATKEIFEALALDQEIDLSIINNALDSMVDSIERNPDALMWLAKLKQTDNIAYNHALNVSITLMALASFLSLTKKQVKDLGLAGLLQDIGKSKIPYALLHKQEKITKDEFELLKKHVNHAIELLQVTNNISETVISTVSQHHERIDGSGYPSQLKGNKISLTGQMAGIVDTYCALTTNKVYAKGVYNQIALEEIHTLRDVKFNGVLIDQLVQFLGMYPVSSLVELNSGEVGVVIQQNSVRRLLPRVLILLNQDKSKNEYPAVINLINAPPNPTGEPYRILRGLPPDSYGLNSNNYYG